VWCVCVCVCVLNIRVDDVKTHSYVERYVFCVHKVAGILK